MIIQFSNALLHPQKLLYIVILLLSITVYLTKRRNHRASNIPGVVSSWPAVGNFCGFLWNPVSFLRDATSKYGGIFRTNLILTDVIWLRSTKLNRIYLETKEVGNPEGFDRSR